MSRMATYYCFEVPLPLPKPRDRIYQSVRVEHDDEALEVELFDNVVRKFVEWAEHHDQHPKLPGEWAERSYLRRPIVIRNLNDTLDQLAACGVRVRVIVTTADARLPVMSRQMRRELFSSPDTFAVFTEVEPSLPEELN